MASLYVPAGQFGDQDTAEDAAARRRRQVRDQMMRGEDVYVTPAGQVTDKDHASSESAIKVPPGKLAAGFYWYQRDPELYRGEREAMQRHFSQFQMETLSDGRLAWNGLVRPDNLRPGAKWYLQAVYENNHPSNNTYGGSIKVYSVEPDLDEISREIGGIPHVLRDSRGHVYICTSRPEDFQASHQRSSTAAVAISWAVKWISVFELWMAGDVTTSQFASHVF